MKNRSIPVRIAASAFVLALIPFGSQALQSTQQAAQPAATSTAAGLRGQPTPQQLAMQQASKEDHQQTMDQLHIASLRPGVNARVAGSTNYDEAKANPYPNLPDDRAMDYSETDKAVDAKHVAIQGHSRYGKAATVTIVYDPRIAIVFVSSSGEGGAKLHRRNFGELVENVAGENEYHWMAGNFLKYAGPLKWSDTVFPRIETGNPEWRSGLPPAQRGAHAQPELALFPGFCRT